MIRAIFQVNLNNDWENNKPVVHEFKDKDAAVEAAYVLSHQFNNTAVRITYPSIAVETKDITVKYVSRMSGVYVASTESNYLHT
jgi:hypothetical protein